jgi:hypothetical protein
MLNYWFCNQRVVTSTLISFGTSTWSGHVCFKSYLVIFSTYMYNMWVDFGIFCFKLSLRKLQISVHLPVSVKELWFHWVDFHFNLYWGVLQKSVNINQFWLNLGKNNCHFTQTQLHILRVHHPISYCTDKANWFPWGQSHGHIIINFTAVRDLNEVWSYSLLI